MSALVDSTPQPFNLDAILQEFNIEQPQASTKASENDLTIARVRESLGLGRSLFRRKETQPQNDEETSKDEEDAKEMSLDGNDESQEKVSKPRRRILDSDDDDDDDDDDEDMPTFKPSARQSSPVQSPSYNDSDDDDNKPTNDVANLDSDDDFSTGNFLADFRKARLEALSAKRAAQTRAEKETTPESAPSERSISPVRSVSQSPPRNGRKPKARKASKKALDEMQRETQRMARNMGLRPEIKTLKKIEMSTIFAKFGFVPNKPATEETAVVDATLSPEQIIEQRGRETPAPPPENPSKSRIDTQTPVQPPKDVDMVDSDYESGSDDLLPSPSKIASTIAAYKKANAAPKKSPTPRKVQFTLPPASSSSDSDSDVEIIPPPSRLSTHLATPDRKRVKRANLIRSLANIKSPVQNRSPGRMTQKELDATLSREAAVQSAQKREERRAELKKLGIDVEKVVEKRDLLEEAREEARRIREEEGGEESDEEYVDEEENDADFDEESGDDAMESGEDEEDAEESADEEMEGSDDEISDDAPTKKKPRAVIMSDDEDDIVESSVTIPESTIASQRNIPKLADLRPTDDVSLTQFFKPTQMSGSTESTTQMPKGNTQSVGTGLTQFFMSTAMDDDTPLSGEDAAHNRMELLRQKAGQGIVDFGEESIGFPGVEHPVIPSVPSESPHAAMSDTEESPVRRRILKRRGNTKVKPSELPQETSEEFKKARKEFVEEQAEESEDDYAAWGSGDESENENMDGVVEGLIDDDTKIKKNAEREVARLYMYSI
jgi:mediator of replication checkpoint protein 1